jgi:hypothetical protein
MSGRTKAKYSIFGGIEWRLGGSLALPSHQRTIRVPLVPASAAARWLTWAMMATASAWGELRTKSMPVSIFGRIEPAPKWPALRCASASSAVSDSSRCSFGLP